MVDFDFIDWGDPEDPQGVVQHIADNGVTVEEVEEVLDDSEGGDGVSRTTGRLIRFGWTSTGRHLAVIYEADNDGGLVMVRPITAYEVPPEGDERNG